MEIESAKCECCGLKEDCTQDYISEVKAKFKGKWLCGLCSEAVKDEVNKEKQQFEVDEAVKAHMSFCSKFRLNPAVRVAGWDEAAAQEEVRGFISVTGEIICF
ncbi:hypothetical protein L1049_021299 [Liquidambar formosana]|uniref:DUF1677 family protein n=1 Tax=Liquidambar formosana TaxID=63359 RepID=A0AAP0SAG0_LIQFO